MKVKDFCKEIYEFVGKRFTKLLAYLWYGFDLISLMISPKYFNKYFNVIFLQLLSHLRGLFITTHDLRLKLTKSAKLWRFWHQIIPIDNAALLFATAAGANLGGRSNGGLNCHKFKLWRQNTTCSRQRLYFIQFSMQALFH